MILKKNVKPNQIKIKVTPLETVWSTILYPVLRVPHLEQQRKSLFCIALKISTVVSFFLTKASELLEQHKEMCNGSFEQKIKFQVPYISDQKDLRAASSRKDPIDTDSIPYMGIEEI
jgi:hypothetical protein